MNISHTTLLHVKNSIYHKRHVNQDIDVLSQDYTDTRVSFDL